MLVETDPELDELRDYFSNVYSNNRLHKFALKVKNELVLKNAEALLDGRAIPTKKTSKGDKLKIQTPKKCFKDFKDYCFCSSKNRKYFQKLLNGFRYIRYFVIGKKISLKTYINNLIKSIQKNGNHIY